MNDARGSGVPFEGLLCPARAALCTLAADAANGLQCMVEPRPTGCTSGCTSGCAAELGGGLGGGYAAEAFCQFDTGFECTSLGVNDTSPKQRSESTLQDFGAQMSLGGVLLPLLTCTLTACVTASVCVCATLPTCFLIYASFKEFSLKKQKSCRESKSRRGVVGAVSPTTAPK